MQNNVCLTRFLPCSAKVLSCAGLKQNIMKKTKIILMNLLVVSSLIISCGGPVQQKTGELAEKTDQDVFFDRFRELEGKKFAGKQVYIREDMDSWADFYLEMHVREFHENVIYLPFRVGENTSRTWTIYREPDNRLRLRHDHRHEDGTPEDLTLYGGYTVQGSDAFTQIFPADDYTCNMLPRICDNEWSMKFSEDLSTFTYILKKSGELVFQADFDLTTSM
jgi:hypothetical protein